MLMRSPRRLRPARDRVVTRCSVRADAMTVDMALSLSENARAILRSRMTKTRLPEDSGGAWGDAQRPPPVTPVSVPMRPFGAPSVIGRCEASFLMRGQLPGRCSFDRDRDLRFSSNASESTPGNGRGQAPRGEARRDPSTLRNVTATPRFLALSAISIGTLSCRSSRPNPAASSEARPTTTSRLRPTAS